MQTKLVTLAVGASLLLAPGNLAAASSRPIATVVRHGGLCATGSECRSVFRVTDTRLTGEGYVSRHLSPASRSALLRAIAAIKLSYLRKHPFKGTCPTAHDGTESVYRFRGFRAALPSCKYDLRGLAAVRLTERLLGTLKRA